MAEKRESTDSQLVRMTLTGDHEAYRRLVGRYQGHVYGLAYSLVGDWAEAQDVAQETFIRAYSNLDKLRELSKFAAWLRRVAFGVAMDWLRAFRPKLFEQLDGRVDLDHLEIPHFEPGPPEIAQKRELADAVLAAVASLPAKYRVPLTMFHLDGLSYQKVADFLDIPLGTAKSMIHRARAKLRAALPTAIAKEMTPMVQEVFDEHKLPEEFASKVLAGVVELSYRTTECTFCGSVCAYMAFVGDPIASEFAMGVSGSAFKLIWNRKWCPSNNALLVLGLEPIQRTFQALGYEYEFIPKTESTEQEFRRRILESIHQGRPVLTEGIIGPPEVGIIAGFDDKGDILLGRSFFHESQDYYRKAGWYADCHSLILVGRKTQPVPRPRREVLRDALEWAVQLAHTAEMEWPGADRVLGLAAYDAWAEALKRDEDFPAGDPKVLTFRCQVSGSVTYCGLCEARRTAVEFLREAADDAAPARSEILAAAGAYEAELDILEAKPMPWCQAPEPQRLQMTDRGFRMGLVEVILAARDKDREAVEHLEQALKVLQA